MTNLIGLNVVDIRSEDDFPDAIGGFYNLEENIQYVLGNDVTITDKIKYANGSSIIGNGVFGSVLTYNGVGSMISSEDNFAQISNIGLNAPNGKVFDITTNISTTSTFLIQSVSVTECEDYGTFDVNGTIINNSDCLNCKTSGIVMSGTGLVLSIKEFAMFSATAGLKFIDLGSFTGSTIEMQNFLTFSTSGGAAAIGISGLASSGNVNTGSIASVQSCEFLGNITPLSGITENDIRWNFKTNSANVVDTRIVAGMNIPATQTVTITTAGVPVIVNDANTGGTNIWALKTARKFEFSASLGRMTYKGEKPVYINISATATVSKSGGGADVICGFIAMNGTVVSDSQACTQNSNPTAIPVQTGVDMVTDDYIEFAVQNNDTTANILVDLSNLEIF